MKIVIASDSFKGSLSSSQVADAVSEGVRAIYPSAEIIKIKVADGGEGMTDAIIDNTEAELLTLRISDPLGRRINAVYGLINNGTTAVIESAAASGLMLLSPHERNPLLTSTFGTGEMIADALRRGCRRFMIGLGGSATNDGGIGMLTALGYKFMDSNGQVLAGNGYSLNEISSIDSSEAIPSLAESEFIVACDVDNPFFGPYGAAQVFAPQKGANAEMVNMLDKGLQCFAGIIHKYCGRDISAVPGTGAAGGLGGAMLAFLNARLVRGIDMILDAVDFDKLICGADLVISGEGKIDEQTARGKVPYGVLKRAQNQGIPVLAIAGKVENSNIVDSLGFSFIIQTSPEGMPTEIAMQPEIAKNNISSAVRKVLMKLR